MITLALIGDGLWGRNYLKTIQSLKGVRVKYICTHSTKSSASANKGIITLNDHKKLFSYNDYDGVIIATPASTHYSIAKSLLKRGKNILVEKPFTVSLSDSDKLLKLYMKRKPIVMVDHIFLYNDAFLQLVNLVKGIGRIRYVELQGCDWGPIRTDTSALWDWSPHDIAMCLAIVGEKPISVSAWSPPTNKINFPEMVYTRLVFKNNINAFIKVGWLSPLKQRTVFIVGTKGSLLFDDLSEKKLTFIKKTSNNESKVFYPPYAKTSPLVSVVRAFVKSIQTHKQPESNIYSGLDIVKIITAIEKSLLKKGREIPIPNDLYVV